MDWKKKNWKIILSPQGVVGIAGGILKCIKYWLNADIWLNDIAMDHILVFECFFQNRRIRSCNSKANFLVAKVYWASLSFYAKIKVDFFQSSDNVKNCSFDCDENIMIQRLLTTV